MAKSKRNPRYYDAGGWKARERMLTIVRERVQAGEPCALCGQPIDLSLPQLFVDPKDGKRKRAPWSLECDEIVPVSKGGCATDPENIQPTHRICNQRKGAGKTQTQKGKAPIFEHNTADGANARRW